METMPRLRRIAVIAILTFLGGLSGALVGPVFAQVILGPALKGETEGSRAVRVAIGYGSMFAGALVAPLFYDLKVRRR